MKQHNSNPWQRHLPVLAGLMLVPLHGALRAGFGEAGFQLLAPNHFLIFLIWLLLCRKPGSSPIHPVVATLLVLPVVLWEQGPLSLSAWLALLSALFLARLVRTGGWPYLGGCLYGLFAIFAYLLPEFAAQLPAWPWVHTGLNLLLLLAIATSLIPLSRERPTPAPNPAVAPIALLAFIAVAGLTLWFLNADRQYGEALGLAALAVGGLLLLALAFAGLSKTPSAARLPDAGAAPGDWVERLQELSAREDHPAEFLELALQSLQDIDQLSGYSWRTGDLHGTYGTRTAQVHQIVAGELELSFFCTEPVDAHLGRELEQKTFLLELYLQNLRLRQKLRAQSHMEAIYETGARITHDVKNLLQSLGGLNEAVQKSRPKDAEELRQLLLQQLPQLTQRIERTLHKLQSPDQVSRTFQVASLWWGNLKSRYQGSAVEFSELIELDLLLPRDLFDRVTENLLENARRKQQMDASVTIQARLEIAAEQVLLAVCDSGARIPSEVEKELFNGPVESSGGYGIGLYQCAQQANAHGFRLVLENNEQGHVCFLLAGAIDAGKASGAA